ncbi:MAG: DUF296 domain-containing protein [Thermoplasmata archaeon]|nr:DUF296 domain-containing protein [Thermoplasmata archaeon]
MHGKMNGNFVVLKLDEGEELFECLEKAIAEYDIKSGIIVSGIGMMVDFEIGYFEDGEYDWKVYEEAYELIAMHGSISTKGETMIHIHVALAGPDHGLIGGHLKRAKVSVLNEILILKLDNMEFDRVLNPKSGLKELHID